MAVRKGKERRGSRHFFILDDDATVVVDDSLYFFFFFSVCSEMIRSSIQHNGVTGIIWLYILE